MAEFFLQRTPAERIADFYPSFVDAYPTPESLAKADPEHLKRIAHRLGLKKRMSWLVESMKTVIDKYEGKIPNDLDDLMQLKGVGRYTASAILCFGFGRDIPIVDANVVRVLSRIYDLAPIGKGLTDKSISTPAKRMVPKGFGPRYNEGLLDFAAIICKKNPSCDRCPIAHLCDFYKRTHNM